MFLSPRGDRERPKIAPRPPQDHPKTAQERPKTAQERLKTAQDDPRATQDEARPSQERPRAILPHFLERKRLQEALRTCLSKNGKRVTFWDLSLTCWVLLIAFLFLFASLCCFLLPFVALVSLCCSVMRFT